MESDNGMWWIMIPLGAMMIVVVPGMVRREAERLSLPFRREKQVVAVISLEGLALTLLSLGIRNSGLFSQHVGIIGALWWLAVGGGAVCILAFLVMALLDIVGALKRRFQ
jgi:hypothetical protein